ncbi:tRNA pseudouridine(38-40) synthase TruA [Aegicerativicinus sediminis]|uniref:tRNA pseudouridine(38-40) synthase TruA n=1 Tax=Aegicerativicinus sediminis TaxID=2893202 RepID=UPI001E5BA8F4|nr:tRNA pseudouridine(38-40) synthase TruA [Aegicerativicinus sediminis]
MRYFIKLSYDGLAYHGWQNQPNALSVQEVLEKSISTILGVDVEIVGAGRTDTGVHAKEMFAHFDYDSPLIEEFVFKMNSFLPKDIAIQNVFEMQPDAHARFDAVSRTYHYHIHIEKDPFLVNHSYQYGRDLDLKKMNDACKILYQYTDFQCFSKSNTDVKTYCCKVTLAEWFVDGNNYTFIITANRFLRNMVRAIVGTMLMIGSGKLEVEELHNIIKSKDRSNAGFSVPSHGLYLTEVRYPENYNVNN